MEASGVPSPGQTRQADLGERASAGRCRPVCPPAAARSSGSASCPRCCTRTAKPGKSPFGLEAAPLACRSRREAEETQPAGTAAGRCSARCKIRVRGAASMLSARTRRGGRGARCRPGGAGCPQRGWGAGRERMPVPSPGSSSELLGGRSGHLCPCAPRGGPERGRSGPSLLSHPAGTRGSPPRTERRSRGVPRYSGQGLGVRIHSLFLHLRDGRGCG